MGLMSYEIYSLSEYDDYSYDYKYLYIDLLRQHKAKISDSWAYPMINPVRFL